MAHVAGDEITLEGPNIVAGSVGIDWMMLDLDDSWSEFDSIAIRYGGSGTTIPQAWEGVEQQMPWEPIVASGYCTVTVVGYVGSVERKVTRAVRGIPIDASRYFDHDAEAQPSHDVTAQMLERIAQVEAGEGARMYRLGPGESAILMDADADRFYLVQADAVGMTRVRAFDFVEHAEEHAAPPDFVRRDEIADMVRAELERWTNEQS